MGLLTGACSRALRTAEETEGLFVIDLDTKDGKDGVKVWRTFVQVHLNGIEPQTWMAKSGGGGLHLFFLAPKGWAPPTIKLTAIGVDFRGQGGFIVVEPSMHPNGGFYEFLPGFGPGDCELAMAPAEVTGWVDALRLEHGGTASGPRAERTDLRGVVRRTNSGGDIDGREEKLANLAWAVVVDMYREAPIKPSWAAVEAEIQRAFERYELTTKSRLTPRYGHSNADLLELEGRGISALRQKVIYALAQWDGKVAEAAKVPKSEAPGGDSRNTWGEGLGGEGLGGGGGPEGERRAGGRLRR